MTNPTITLTEAEKLELVEVIGEKIFDIQTKGIWNAGSWKYAGLAQDKHRDAATAALTAALEWINKRKHG